MLTVLELITIDGTRFDIDMEDIETVAVLDEGLTNDDYTDAQDISIVTKDGEEYRIDLFDNLGYKDQVWDLFQTM